MKRNFPGNDIKMTDAHKNQKTCNNCKKPGHLAKDCRFAQNNNGGNGNPQQNQNGRGSKNGKGHNNYNNSKQNSKSDKQFVDPKTTEPNDSCYLHKGNSHMNFECKNKNNRWFQSNNGQQQQPQQQQQQQQQGPRVVFPQQGPKPKQQAFQQNGAPVFAALRYPISGADFNYCERCNETGHTAIHCGRPAVNFSHMKCMRCGNEGHDHSVCVHPALCARCHRIGHAAADCAAQLSFATAIGPNQAQREHLRARHAEINSLPPLVRFGGQGTFSHAPQNRFGQTKAYFANGAGEIILEAPMDEVQQELSIIVAEREAARRKAIADKCCRAHTMYSMKLLNGEIMEGAEFFRRLDPRNPQIQLPPDVQRTEALERLVQFWINDNSFWNAAAMIKKGWNYFRDPRVLDAIARNSKPVCHCCSAAGHIFSATFTELFPGTDVLTVEDYDMWGPMVGFRCQCSVNGYSFLQGVDDGRMDLS